MTLVEATVAANALVSLAARALEAHQRIATLRAQAELEGRSHLTDEEWAALGVDDDVARARLAGLIEAAPK